MQARGNALAGTLMAALVLAAGCAQTGRVDDAVRAARAGQLESARAALEAERERQPASAPVRSALGEVYYLLARRALDRHADEEGYLAYLERAVHEFVTALEMVPDDHGPHFYLAVMDVYRGDLDAALRGFQNAERLQPSGIACTNLGEIYAYRGELRQAREWTLQGLRRGAGAGPVTFNRMLIEWREGDLRSARAHFETLWKYHPDLIATINVAPLPREPETFDEFAGYCCSSPACGPYLEAACRKLGLEVGQRKLSEENALRELRIEMEKTRRMREIYQQRRELEIEVEPSDEP